MNPWLALAAPPAWWLILSAAQHLTRRDTNGSLLAELLEGDVD